MTMLWRARIPGQQSARREYSCGRAAYGRLVCLSRRRPCGRCGMRTGVCALLAPCAAQTLQYLAAASSLSFSRGGLWAPVPGAARPRRPGHCAWWCLACSPAAHSHCPRPCHTRPFPLLDRAVGACVCVRGAPRCAQPTRATPC